jgi:hypothetical protein
VHNPRIASTLLYSKNSGRREKIIYAFVGALLNVSEKFFYEKVLTALTSN